MIENLSDLAALLNASAVFGATWQELMPRPGGTRAAGAIELALAIVVVILLAVFGGRLLILFLRRLADRAKSDLASIILEAVRPQIRWLIAAIGFQIVTSRLGFLNPAARHLLETVYFLLYLFVAVSSVWRVGDALVDWYIAQRKDDLNEDLVNQVMPLLKRLAHLALAIITAAIIAGFFGIDVLAISTALGLSGFAIALAAKDSITNIISGLVIMVDGPFKIGDRIDIPTLDAWGDIVEIGIRSSQVLTRDNRLVVVPNSAIVDNVVVNLLFAP